MSGLLPHSVNPIAVLLCCDGRDEKQVAVYESVLAALGGAPPPVAAVPVEAPTAKGKAIAANKSKAAPAPASVAPVSAPAPLLSSDIHPNAALVKVLRPDELFDTPNLKNAAEASKRLKNLLSIRSDAISHSEESNVPSSIGARAPCVYVLSDAFPQTLGNLQDIITTAAAGSEFPIIDGVINLICRGDDSAKR
jgi:hypothetical protein